LNWGLGIGDWGLGLGPNPQSPIPNPHYYQNYHPKKNFFIIKKLNIYLKKIKLLIKILIKN
jgi:hypothetical protein